MSHGSEGDGDQDLPIIFPDNINYSENEYDALKEADALLILTEWNEFRNPDYTKVKSLMKQHVIFDGRNLFDGKHTKKHGFVHYSIGRSVVKP